MTVGVPSVVVVVVHVVMPWEKEQPAGTAEAGLPPEAALAVPATKVSRAADTAKDAEIRVFFNRGSEREGGLARP